MLNKIVFKSLLKNKFLIMAVSILFCFATILLSLSILTFTNMQKGYDNFKIETNQEDFRFYGINELNEKYDQGFENGFETQFNAEIEKHNYFKLEEEDLNYIILQYNDYDINKAKLVKGNYPINENEIIISQKTSELYDLEVDQTYKINDTNYIISGIGYIPEYTLSMDLATGSGGINSDTLTPIYMNKDSYNKINKSNELLYYSGKFNEQFNDEIYKQMKDTFFTPIPKMDENGIPILDENMNIVTKNVDMIAQVVPSDVNFPLAGFQFEIKSDKTMFRVMSFVVTSITLALTIVLFNNIFRTQKREMGILKAEGISFKELSTKFSLSLFVVTFISSMLGFVIAIMLVAPLTKMLLTFYEVPIANDSLPYLTNFIVLLLLNIIVCVLIYFFAIYRNLKTPPLYLIKNIETDKLPSKRLFKFLDKTSFKTRYRINIMIRNIKTTLILIFGVFVSSFLLLLGMLMISSIKDMVSQTYSEMFIYDYSATYSDTTKFSETDYSTLEKEAAIISSTSEKILKDDQKMDLYGFNVEKNELINLENEKGDQINDEAFKEGIVLSNVVATTLGVQKDDIITFENPYGDNNIVMRVSEIANDGTTLNAYFDLDYLQNQLGVENDFVTGQVGTGDHQDELLKLDSNLKYTDSSQGEQQMWDSIKIILMVVTVQSSFAVIISFIALITISSIVISKNKKTISVMKVLGYTDSEVNIMTTSIYKWIVICVYFLSLPLFEIMFQKIINQALGETDFAVVINIDLFAALLGFSIIFITYLISSKISKRSIRKISLAESLKVDE